MWFAKLGCEGKVDPKQRKPVRVGERACVRVTKNIKTLEA